jgi:hypothetical protein
MTRVTDNIPGDFNARRITKTSNRRLQTSSASSVTCGRMSRRPGRGDGGLQRATMRPKIAPQNLGLRI